VSAPPQLFCSSEGTVVLIHGFAPPGLASNHRGGGNSYTLNFYPEAAGRACGLFNLPIAIRRSPRRDRRRAAFLFGPVRGKTNFSASQQKFRERFTAEQLGFVSAWRCRARGTPDEEPAPLRRGFCLGGPRHPTPGPLLVGNRLAAWRNYNPKVRGTVAPSHQSDSDFRRGAKLF
jgi:hypothetical protein